MSQVRIDYCAETEKQRSKFEHDVIALTPALRAFAYHFYRTKDDIDDLVQETLLKALRFRDKFQPGTNLKSWMFTIMRNLFFTQFHCRKREPVMEDKQLDLWSVSPPSQEWALYERDVAMAIDRLPFAFRSALLQVSAGVSYEDAAQSLGCEVGTIKSRVSRARHHLMAEFDGLFSGSEISAF
jgi:RNA polymerase sigma-70 factor (ECF subfamily)